MLVIGLTGGIGSGKSTVADLFAKQGAPIIDTDVIAHRLSGCGGAAIAPIRATFGDNYIDSTGALDRAGMRALVFADPSARHRLEQLLHPMILAEVESSLAQIDAPYAIVVVPLLAQSPEFVRLSSRTLVVDCDDSTRISRVMRRSRLSESEVHAIIASQTPRSRLLELADDIIRNDTDLESLSDQVLVLHRQYLQNSD